MYKHLFFFSLFLLTFLSFSPAYNLAYALEKIEVATVDPQINTIYGTFQSHNQKMVANQYGIFMTYLQSGNDAEWNTWCLLRSTDGGKTFATIYENTNYTRAPVIETDDHGTIYLAHPDWGADFTGTNSYLYRFTPKNNFTKPAKTTIPNSASGKYSMILDKSRGQLYYFSYENGSFTVIGINGRIKSHYQLTTPGTSAYVMYPYLYLDENNVLYAAWTNQKFGVYLYWDIHFVLSKDGGATWQKPDGKVLSLPIVSDETGPTDRITLNDEFDVHTWLWTLIVKNGKVHLPYRATTDPYRQHYVRFDLATAKKDLDTYPVWKGETISFLNLDGFCATRVTQSDFPLYCISRTVDGHLGVLVSYDNGTSWHDYAVSDFNDQGLYAIGGAREVTADGYIIGSYTDARTINAVRFFKVKVGPSPTSTTTITPTSTPSPTPGKHNIFAFNQLIPDIAISESFSADLDDNKKVDITDYNILVSDFGKTGTPGFIPADINKDGIVDIFDYNILVANFGKST